MNYLRFIVFLVVMALLIAIIANLASASAHTIPLHWDWTPNQVPATKFIILRGDNVSGPFHKIATVPISMMAFVDSNVKARKAPYCYEVVAKGKTESAPSNVWCGVVGP